MNCNLEPVLGSEIVCNEAAAVYRRGPERSNLVGRRLSYGRAWQGKSHACMMTSIRTLTLDRP